MAALCAARGMPHATLRLGGAGDGAGQPAGPGARGAARADRATGRAARGIGGGGARAYARRSGGDLPAAAGARVRGRRAERHGAGDAGARGCVWLRPLLGVRRAALRDWLRGARRRLGRGSEQRRPAVRAGAGARGAAAAGAARARRRSGWRRRRRRWRGRGRRWRPATADAGRASALTQGGAGDLVLDPGPLAAAPEEIAAAAARRGALPGSRARATGRGWRGSRRRCAAIDAGRVGHGLTLHGCVLRARGGRVAIRREPARVAPPVPLARGRWDGRWQRRGAGRLARRSMIGALGTDGLAALGGLACDAGSRARRC